MMNKLKIFANVNVVSCTIATFNYCINATIFVSAFPLTGMQESPYFSIL